MSQTIPLSMQIAGGEILLAKAREMLRKAGVRPAEIDLIIAQQEALIATARSIVPVQDQVRDLVRSVKRSAI